MRSELERQNFDIIAFVGKCRELDGTQLAEALTAVEGTVADELNQHMKHSEDEIKTLLTHVLEACSQPHILQLSEQLTDTLKAYQVYPTAPLYSHSHYCP
jgi:cellobiose-specific phosphotransferase system component IIA